ncbi:MAG TPA: hypothetical protein VGJ20_21155 [Xanthobacteraceae bacterium]|jgi:hypothetical protein
MPWRRTELERQREIAADALAELKIKAAGIAGQRRVADAEPGPVRYLATLLGTTHDATMRVFILLVSLLLDPAAAADSRRWILMPWFTPCCTSGWLYSSCSRGLHICWLLANASLYKGDAVIRCRMSDCCSS